MTGRRRTWGEGESGREEEERSHGVCLSMSPDIYSFSRYHYHQYGSTPEGTGVKGWGNHLHLQALTHLSPLISPQVPDARPCT